MCNIMDKLEGLLFRFGIYRCQEGYDCILAAMELVEEDETLLKRLIGGLYPAAAARCGNTRTSVERNIRSRLKCLFLPYSKLKRSCSSSSFYLYFILFFHHDKFRRQYPA